MNAPEIVVWLIPGYLILLLYRRVYPSRTKQGWEWVIQTAVAAVGCFLSSRAALALLLWALPAEWVPQIREWWARELPFRYSFSLALALLLVPVCALLLCWFAPMFVRMGDWFAKGFAVRASSDMFYSECYRLKDESIFITLESGKVYVGILSAFTNDVDEPERFVKILPILSGYRQEKTLLPIITTDYIGTANSVEEVEAEPILIPAKHIATMTKFNVGLMRRFVAQGTTKIAIGGVQEEVAVEATSTAPGSAVEH